MCVLQGLSAEESNTPKASTTPANKQKRVTFRIYFPMPPFDGIHFNALKAGHGAYNFTVSTNCTHLQTAGHTHV